LRHPSLAAALLMGVLATGGSAGVAQGGQAVPDVIPLTVGSTSAGASPTSFVERAVMKALPQLYQRVGLTINSVSIPLGQAVQLVESASPPVAEGLGPTSVAFGHMHGATNVKIFAGMMQKSPYELVVRHGITKLTQIKTLGVPSVASASSQNCQTILRSASMQANRDYALVLLGNSAARITAVQTGKVDGSCEPVPYPEYYRDTYGMTILAKASAHVPYYATGAWIYNAKWAQDPVHRAALLRLVQVILLAHRWTMDPVHKNEVEALAAKAFNLPAPYAQLYYAEVVGQELLTPDGYIPKQAALGNQQDHVNMGTTGTPPDLSQYYDWSILQEAAKVLGIPIRQPEY
jgi:hypothetical protein